MFYDLNAGRPVKGVAFTALLPTAFAHPNAVRLGRKLSAYSLPPTYGPVPTASCLPPTGYSTVYPQFSSLITTSLRIAAKSLASFTISRTPVPSVYRGASSGAWATPVGRSLCRATLIARSPRINTARKHPLHGERWTIVRFFSFNRRDHPYLRETDFHSWTATPCSSASHSTNCFHTLALKPRAAEISSAVGFSALPTNAFGISMFRLTLCSRHSTLEYPGEGYIQLLIGLAMTGFVYVSLNISQVVVNAAGS